MEEMVIDNKFWKNKKVFITGNTGFKGSWLSIILSDLGANVRGYALKPKEDFDIFNKAKLIDNYETDFKDVTNFLQLNKAVMGFKPDIVFHLAAQPLVRYSYDNPIETYSTNVMGTLNILESIKNVETVKSSIIVTTDKCYKIQDDVFAYKEDDILGGGDPYSSSKACAEILTDSYRRSYKTQLASTSSVISTVRAGNVIGGGDWSEDRLIPDIAKSLISKKKIILRNPGMIRPWQHVLDPLIGYIKLAEKMFIHGEDYESSWNFGPNISSCINVEEIAKIFLSHANSNSTIKNLNNSSNYKHETNYLRLDISKVREKLKWKPKWDIDIAVKKTARWYDGFSSGKNAYDLCLNDINTYLR
jgi:CDP-glucose 4,6-dehydratase